MSPPNLQPNSKRYWADEKNIDSIYSIYLKKISYSYSNDVSMSSAYQATQQQQVTDRRHRQRNDDEQSATSASSHDLAGHGTPVSASSHLTKGLQNEDRGSCRSKEESPRSRKNFFQKYRRRSCSMDKYSFEKQAKQKNSTQSSKNNNKNMRFNPKQSDKTSQIKEDLSVSHDQLDGPSVAAHMTPNNYKKINEQNLGDLKKSLTELTSHNQSTQSLQWETRQIRVLQAATLDHALKFILLINSTKDFGNLDPDSSLNSSIADSSALEEERNNVAHITHVMFCTYRIYTNPYELMLKLMDYSDICRVEQYRFVMQYWMDNYPEDFDYVVELPENSSQRGASPGPAKKAPSLHSHNGSTKSFDSSITTRTARTTDSDTSRAINDLSTSSIQNENLDRRLSNLSIKTNEDPKQGIQLVDELLRLCEDPYVRKRALKLTEIKAMNQLDNESSNRNRSFNTHNGHKKSAILDLDSRYVAQQLTALDLENFLNLKPYSLLEGTKSDKKIQSMVKNFNLLSRQVVVTIIISHSPHAVTSHWIAIAMNLRKIKNFNSLKAVIAGLTNESVYRLKSTIWSKLDKASITNFKQMASIVDDVNNQTVLRQTQLIVEGTAKMSIEDDSFGTIPYLGTFLTDLNMIDARYQTYVPSPKDETSKLKLINFEKCAKQFEILTQVQLLQKNVLASLHAIQRRNHFDEQSTLDRSRLDFNQSNNILLSKPALPQVSRLFENWFYDNQVATMTDKQCYEISVKLEPNAPSK